ncbi:MAG: family 10 glycosylhydrolase [Paludibacteraceae bacterium]|nr:family 10 glycosylhydrolase [Paludibacteraceae bacterium]
MKSYRLLWLPLVFVCQLSFAVSPKIYINPGHGGYNSNDRNIVTINYAAGNHDGFWESKANLTKGLYLRDMLQAAGATVYMSRTDNRSGYRDDKSISNTIGDRPLSTIAREASNEADFFLSIHSNAGGNSTTTAVNYLLLMLTGTAGSSDWGSSFKYSEAVTAAGYAWTRLYDNPLTAWTSTTRRVMSYTTYTVISPSYLTIPGYLSEGEFHDYKPETHRLLNDDYCKLEAYRFLQAFCDYYSSSLTRPATGVICGDVRDATATMSSVSLYQKATGDKDNYTPLNGAKVKLKDSSGNVIATYICDNEYNGFYAFWDVAPGTYTVQCAADNHASVSRTVTVTAANITYNNVKLGAGSGDGMEDVIVSPLGILYDTLLSSTTATSLDAQTIRRAVVKDDEMYVLNNNSQIFVINANTGEQTGCLSTNGMTVSSDNANTKLINDIALTDDNTLLGCQLEQTTFGLSNYWKVFSWADNNQDPTVFCQSRATATAANFTTANTGYTFCVKGTNSTYELYTLALSVSGTNLRAVSYDINGSTKYSKNDGLITTSNFTDNTLMVASPYGTGQFVLESPTMQPTLYSGTWIASGTTGNLLSTVSTLNLPDVALTGGTFTTYDNHILYITPYGTDNVGVGIYDATNGFGSATLIKTLYPETVLPLSSAGYMTATAQTDGDELVVTLYVQNRGIDRYRLSQTDLEAQNTVVGPNVDLLEGNAPKRELRAGWISTSWALDWPVSMGTSSAIVSTQKNNMDALFDRMQSARMNAVLFQVRGMCDAMYNSAYEPWSKYLTGTRGTAPSYDPLQYAITQAHNRGLELHAWINPYRYSSSAATFSNSLANDLARTHNDWLLYYGDATPDTVILNPGIPAVRTYIANIVADIINKYDVDGIVFDDYFYINGKTTNTMDQSAYEAYNPDNLSRADWRRQNVNKLIQEVYDVIKARKPFVRFGVAPPGVAATETAVANKYGITRSPAPSGYDWQYNGQYSEPVQWLEDGTIDYISPQLYWRIGHSTNDYTQLSAWWVQVATQFSRHAYISQSYSTINSATNSSEMSDEINANRTAATANNTYTGDALFRMGQVGDAFVSNLTSAYTEQALPPAMTWYNAPDMSAPTDLTLSGTTLTWQHASAERYSVYAYPKGGNEAQALATSAYLLGISYNKSYDLSSVVNLTDKTVAVCALDRYGNEYTAALYNAATSAGEVAGVAGADIFASELTMNYSSGTYTFSYRLNEDATDVTLQLLYEGNVIQTKSFGAQTKGTRSGTLNEADIQFPERNNDDHLTWAIKATARPINAITKLSDDAAKYQFYRPFGVAVDQNPESEYFGRIYVTNTKNGTCSGGRTTNNGLFAFDAGLNALNTEAYTGEVSWNNANSSGNSPFRMAVAPDGRVFLSDWSDAHSGIWITPAGGITGSFSQLFQTSTRLSSGLCQNSSEVNVHGSISGCWVEGTDENTKLYTIDEDYVVNGKPYNLLRYDIGTSQSWAAAPSAVEFENYANNSPLVNNVLNVVSDRHGGWWIIQHRFAETSLEPSLIHVVNGTIDYNTGGEQLLENSRNGGLAVNYDGTRIATTSQSQINVWDVTYDNNGHLTEISPAFEITATDISGLGESSNDVAFDPAGNIYYVSNTTERLVVIGLPKTDNTFLTPARSIYPIVLPDQPESVDVKITEWEQSAFTVDFGLTPVANGVIAKIGSLLTEALPLETLSSHIATGTTTANNNKHITLPNINLTDYAGKTMTLKWLQNSDVIGQTEVVIPVLVANSDAVALTEWVATTEVVVLPDATATIDLSSIGGLTIRSLEIYPEAKAIISGGTLHLTDLVLRMGWTTNHNTFDVPKLYISNNAAIQKTNAYLDCVIDYAQYYPLSVPFAVTVSEITYRDYPSAPASQGVIFRTYNGEQRATGNLGDNWQTATPATLTPCNGYAITAKRPASIMYSIIRMPLEMTDASLSGGEQDIVSGQNKNIVAVTAHGVGTGAWNDVGWNFISNPYMVSFGSEGQNSFSGMLKIQGDGSGVRYATIPTTNFDDYYQVPIDEAVLKPMSPFFVQAGTTGNLTFAKSAQNPSLAPAYSADEKQPEITTDLRLRFSGSDAFDQTYLLLSNTFTEKPDLNADLPKEFGKAPKIWITFDNNHFASLALSDTLKQYLIPLSVQTGKEDYYVFSITEKSIIGDFDEILLSDSDIPVCNLLNEDYTVKLEAGKTEGRFSLRCIRKPSVATETQDIENTKNNDGGAQKRLVNQHVEIFFNSNTYDVLGNKLK